jgi:hypothetical protein
MKLSTHLIPLVLTVSLAGCATNLPDMQADLSQVTTHIRSYAEMDATTLPVGERIDVSLDKGSPVFDFKTGKSYYSALKLPMTNSSRWLTVRTFLSTGFLPKSTVFVPRFIFLDESRSVVATENNIPLTWATTFQRWQGAHFSGRVAVPINACYVVIFTSNAIEPRLYSQSANGHIRPVPHAPAGSMDVELSAAKLDN